jgi:5-methyltetrahydrofolate--homocysteine methyltransferase
MELFENISIALQQGNRTKVVEYITQGLDQNVPAIDLLNKGLLAGMDEIGEKWKRNEIFIPEVLIAARAMNAGSDLLEAELLAGGQSTIGKVIVGTVQGDLHDIGKNLVGMM